MKVCNIGMGSKLLVIVFLVLLIVLCSFGLMDTGKYSCDKGFFMRTDKASDKQIKDCNTAANKCSSKCSGSQSNNFSKECVECMQDNGCDAYHCIEGHTSEIILIIIISLSGIFLLFKLFCMFQKKGPMAMM